MSESKLTKLEEMATRIACAALAEGNSRWLYERPLEWSEEWISNLTRASVSLAFNIISEAAKHDLQGQVSLEDQEAGFQAVAILPKDRYIYSDAKCHECDTQIQQAVIQGIADSWCHQCNKPTQHSFVLRTGETTPTVRTAAVPTAGEGAPL